MFYKKLRFFVLIVIISIVFTLSCKKPKTYPDIPQIQYLGFMKLTNNNNIDERGILKFSFKDGNGDIGLKDSDTISPYNPSSEYYYNLFLKYYRMENGKMKEISMPIPFHARIPYINVAGKTKTIEGEIEDTIYIFNPLSKKKIDTIQFEFYIVDRALNKSNAVKTDTIFVKNK